MKKSFWPLILVVAIATLVFWPAPDPLADVDTVALATASGGDPGGLEQRVLDGFEVALGKHRIRIVSDRAQADAVIVVEPQSADVRFNIDQEGFRGSATIRCLVRKGGEESVMFLVLTLTPDGLQAELIGRKFWEVWK